MTATTPIYGLSYPEGSDLVSSAAGSFKAMADTSRPRWTPSTDAPPQPVRHL